MNASKKLIHRETALKMVNVISIVLMVALWLFWGFYESFNENTWLIVATIFLIASIVSTTRRNHTFLVYDDRIELRKPLSGRLIETIPLNQIDQVRYEDEFSESYFLFMSDYILIYPQKGAGIKNLKKGRLSLALTGFNQKTRVLKLLTFFQSKDVEVVIKTSSRKIRNATGLENWDKT